MAFFAFARTRVCRSVGGVKLPLPLFSRCHKTRPTLLPLPPWLHPPWLHVRRPFPLSYSCIFQPCDRRRPLLACFSPTPDRPTVDLLVHYCYYRPPEKGGDLIDLFSSLLPPAAAWTFTNSSLTSFHFNRRQLDLESGAKTYFINA